MEAYIVKKKLNNNVILVQDMKRNDMILVGNGIGFKTTVNGLFHDMKKVTQTFVLKNKNNKENLKNIVKKNDSNLIAIIEEEIAYIQSELNTSLNENIHITLIDHLIFALDRSKKNIDFKNPFDDDIAIVYKEEYKVAKHLIARINREFQAKLIKDEIGIVAIHIYAARKNEDISVSRNKTILYEETLKKIYDIMNLQPSKQSLAHQRLLLHVCFAYERIYKNQQIGNEMLDTIQSKYYDDFILLRTSLNQIEETYKIHIPDSEVGYLVLHINRIKNEYIK